MKAFLLCYPLVALLLGTVSGSASWLREAGMHALVVLALGAAFLAAKRQERWPLLGGFFEPLLALLLVVMVAGALQSPCIGRSWRMLLLAAAAAAVFYLVVGLASSGRFQPTATLQLVLPATGTVAALVGLSLYFLGRTPRVVAPLGHHNYMAGFLLLHLPLTAGAAAAARSHPARLFWYAATAAQALAIVLTGSLAGVLVLTGLGLVAPVSRLGFSRFQPFGLQPFGLQPFGLQKVTRSTVHNPKFEMAARGATGTGRTGCRCVPLVAQPRG